MRGIANVTESSIGTPSQGIAGLTSAILLEANLKRSYAIFTNIGATDVYICRGPTAYVGYGICLKANGGSYEILATNLYRGPISAISASAGIAISIEEDV